MSVLRILADENVPGPAVQGLREHDVAWVREDSPGSEDQAILARASAEDRLLVTFDKDFGELAVRLGLTASGGVVLLRLGGASPEEDNTRLIEALECRNDWAGHFTVVEDDRIRMRPLGETES